MIARSQTMTDPPPDGDRERRQRSRLDFPIVQSLGRVAADLRDYPITAAIVGVCVVNFLLLNLSGELPKQAILRILAPPPFSIWGGAVWGLATSAFVHLAWWHILFNMLCARDFGRAVEAEMEARRYVGFVLAAAVVASGWELLVSATGSIGLSGVVFAFFGYMLARRHSQPSYQAILTRRTIAWLLGWLLACFVLTVADVVRIANAAHFSGLAFGYLVGRFAGGVRRRLVMTGLACLGLGVVMATLYMPWSTTWQVRGATRQMDEWRRAGEAGDARAQAMYGSVLARWLMDRRQAMPWLRRSAEAGDPVGMNGLAWWLATAPEDSLRNGEEAVRWAEKIYRLTPTPEAADTLAAAYAETDRWDEAIALQESAVRDVPRSNTQYVREFGDRLERYRKHQKWRELP
jgi:membrane associated rhomboid family serine protease